jgi:predicted adenine nucleotide alpha hydrolase (AANH) superfamily ATPase
LLLHVCCAPCLAAARASLREFPAEFLPDAVRLFFYNPNIHPLLEFRRREKALRVYLERDPLPAEIVSEYGLALFLKSVMDRGEIPERRRRCSACYHLRLEKTAETARRMGFSSFSTTLLASREQDRDLVAEIGAEAAARRGIRFVEADLGRVLPEPARLRGIYRQNYCGCLFSEEERYRDGGRHLYRGSGRT